jgi:hypothetical protein
MQSSVEITEMYPALMVTLGAERPSTEVVISTEPPFTVIEAADLIASFEEEIVK